MDKIGTLKQHSLPDGDTQGQLPLLSVIIPTHQRATEIQALIATLNRQSLQKSSAEILVVSNLPDPKLEQICESRQHAFPMKVLTVGTKGSNRARNLGLQNAKGKWVLLLDDDCLLPDENYFERVIQFHEQWPQVCAVGGAYLNPVNLTPAGRHYNWISNGWLGARFDGPFKTTKLVGGCVSYKNEFLKSQNLLFDEGIVYGGAETEFHLRLTEHGHELYFHPELSVLHDCQISDSNLWRKAIAQGYGKAKRLSTRPNLPKEENGPTFWSMLLKDSPQYELYRRGFMHGERLFRYGLNPSLKIFSVLLMYTPHQYRIWQVIWLVVKGIRLVRRAGVWMYWRTRDVLWRVMDVYWKVYHLVSEARGAFARLKGTWAGRLIRAYWTLYPIGHHLKHQWRRPRSLFFLRIPLTYPNLETNFSARWNWQTTANFVGEERKIKEAEALRLGFQINAVTSVKEIEWKISDINAMSKKDILALHQSEAPGSIHILVDTLPVARKLVCLVDWFKSLIGKTTFSYELAFPKNVDTFEAFRWLHRFSVCTEGLKKEWKARYSYRDQEGKIWKRNGAWYSEKWNQGGQPEISVIIPHHEDFENLQTVLRHLEQQSLAQDRFEVVVVDNAVDKLLLNEKQRQQILDHNLRISFHSIASLNQDAYLAGTARNLGIANSRAEQILFLDSDILLPTDFLEKLPAQLQANDVLMAKRWMLKEGVQEISESALYREDEYWEGLKQAKAWTDLMDYWKYSCTYCFALRRENLLAVGPFDPAFTMYGFEDVDLGFRLFKKGLRFSFASHPCYHLYPRKQGHNYHPESGKREKTLAESAFVFFSLRPERLPFIVTQGYFAPTFPQWVKRMICFWRRS